MNTSSIPIEFCDYSPNELNGVLVHLYNSMQTLANALETSRPDVCVTLDSIMDHPTDVVDTEDVLTLHDKGTIGDLAIKLNRNNNTFTFTQDGQVTTTKALNMSNPKHVDKLVKQIKKLKGIK